MRPSGSGLNDERYISERSSIKQGTRLVDNIYPKEESSNLWSVVMYMLSINTFLRQCAENYYYRDNKTIVSDSEFDKYQLELETVEDRENIHLSNSMVKTIH